MAFIIGLPVAQIILFCWAIGHDPVGLKLAVANYELEEAGYSFQDCPVYPGCNYSLLSCRYMEFLKNRSVVLVSREPRRGTERPSTLTNPISAFTGALFFRK